MFLIQNILYLKANAYQAVIQTQDVKLLFILMINKNAFLRTNQVQLFKKFTYKMLMD